MEHRLAVSVEHAGGAITRWGSDTPDAGAQPQDVQFASSMPGGFSTAQLTLSRRVDRDYPDLALYDSIKIYGPGGETAWEGRVAALPRSHSDDSKITVSCVGWSAHLRDDPTVRTNPVDRELGRWRDQSSTRKVAALAGSWSKLQAPEVAADKSTGLPALVLNNDGPYTATVRLRCEAWYDSPISIRSVTAVFDAVNSSAANQALFLAVADSDAATPTEEVTADLFGTEGAIDFDPTARYPFAYWQWQTVAGASSTNDGNRDVFLSDLAVYGDTGITLRDDPDGGPQGVYSSDVIEYLVSTWAPLLSTDIEATSTFIPHLAFHEPTSCEEAVLRTNAFDFYEWGVYEDREFFYRAPNVDRKVWQARLDEGAKLDLEGEQAEDVFNGVIVSYTDPAGTSLTVGPTGSGADAESDALTDDSPTNPVNAHGIPRRYADLAINTPSTAAGATAIGTVYLAARSKPRRGQVTLQGNARDPSGTLRPPWAVRAGDSIRLADHLDDTPATIIETSYSHDTRTMTCSLDSTSHKVESLLELLGAELVGVVT